MQVQSPRISRQLVHEGGKVVSPTDQPPLPPEDMPGIHSVRSWKIPMTPSQIKPATYQLVAQCLNQLCHCVHILNYNSVTCTSVYFCLLPVSIKHIYNSTSTYFIANNMFITSRKTCAFYIQEFMLCYSNARSGIQLYPDYISGTSKNMTMFSSVFFFNIWIMITLGRKTSHGFHLVYLHRECDLPR